MSFNPCIGDDKLFQKMFADREVAKQYGMDENTEAAIQRYS